ncbi:MAG: NADP-dependent oxidoreductase [Carnobacterium sp.]|uniref:NADP-dependent oxidoreductase n=1 Tax=unclassified Carnobacterium TaxID=257487 RepID=UPI001912449F|nr:NADP-dependent oxidoreductase [Carnobacterium sp. CS13]QQP70232.1 NADP-dependent oxidoreductase [Carnobacterium sp. CS13]
MKAVRVDEFGGPEVLKLEEIETPVPKDDEVLIKVRYAGVLPVDWKIRQGKAGKRNFPYTPGIAASGIIEQVGKDVVGFKIGDAVFGRTKRGAYKEKATIPMTALNHKPVNLSFEQAATIIAGAETAWKALFTQGDLKAGQRVLIHAAAGGVGHYAVQLAKWKGAEVIGTASTDNQSFLKELGVDQGIDYKKQRFEEEVAAVDLVIDLIGGETQDRSWEIIKPGGKLVSLVGIRNPQAATDHLVTGIDNQDSPTLSDLDQLAELMANGTIKTEIEKVYPLEKVREAMMQSETGHGRGRILLKVTAD